MKEFPDFKRGEVKEHFSKLSSNQQKIIEDYVKYVSITSQSPRRLENVKRSLTQFKLLTEKDLDKITLDDLRSFLSVLNSSNKTQATRNEIKHTIKRFLRTNYKDWSDRFNNLEDIKLNTGINEEKINSNTILKKEDIDKLMSVEKNLYWKTFLITLYESGLRPKELRTLTWKKINFDVEDDLSEINIFATKTHKARSVFVKEATFWLKRLKEESNSDLVFPSMKDSKKPIGKELPAVWLGRLTKKVLGRSIYPYILRHTRATELYTNANIPSQTSQKFLGHSKSMSDVYTHLSSEDVKEAMSKTIYKKRNIISKEKESKLEKEFEQMKREQEALKILTEFVVKQSKAQNDFIMEKISREELTKRIEEIGVPEIIKK